MEPMLPESGRAQLSELSCEILEASGRITARIHSTHVLKRVAALVREMNCYYSNLIEGHKTTPREIQEALKHEFSTNEYQRLRQQLGIAHIEVERLMEDRMGSESVDVYSREFICWVHQEFYLRLPEAFRTSKTQSGKTYLIEPGQLRAYMVDVGRHTPPRFDAVPRFLDRFREAYGRETISHSDRLIAIAAAHHRLAWIHPFGDGNGRVVRLHSHALLLHHGLDGSGLWTLSRGLARQRKGYFDHLEGADNRRWNDLDGRGNLSDAGLSAFCRFFLETVLDQIRFMDGNLNLGTLRTRVERYFQFGAIHITKHREELRRVACALIDEGEIQRTRVQEITGRGPTVAAAIIKLGLQEGLIETSSPKGPLYPGFPSQVLDYYFPQLYLDLPIERARWE